jgi:hypothetical protein
LLPKYVAKNGHYFLFLQQKLLLYFLYEPWRGSI